MDVIGEARDGEDCRLVRWRLTGSSNAEVAAALDPDGAELGGGVAYAVMTFSAETRLFQPVVPLTVVPSRAPTRSDTGPHPSLKRASRTGDDDAGRAQKAQRTAE